MEETISQTADELIDRAALMRPQSEQRVEHERRNRPRHPYNARVTLALFEGGRIGEPMVVQSVDISQGGICVEGPKMLHTGREGIIQLVRSDGTRTLVGVRVCHCRYAGKMRHQSGLEFIPLPAHIADKRATQ